MLLTTGIIALSRKVADEKAKRKEARQGHLAIGSSDVAKQAFASQVARRGTEIKYEDPNEITAETPTTTTDSPSTSRPAVTLTADEKRSPTDPKDPEKSEQLLLPASHYEDTLSPISPDRLSIQDTITTEQTEPPPYSPGPQSPASAQPSSVYSRDIDGNTLASWDAKSSSMGSTNSNGTNAIRVKTVGADLKSGFPYHPELFEQKVHPEKWTAFTTQIVESTKFSMNDHAKIWGAATATAMTGAIGTSIFLGRSMNRSMQEKRVKEGLLDPSSDGLGEVLRRWNEDYFNERGLFVHLELSESAMKRPDQKSKAFRKSALLYSNREDRDRKRDERKFVIVVTKLNDEGQPEEALQEMRIAEKVGAVEIASSDEPSTAVSELPGDLAIDPVELPGDVHGTGEKTMDPPSGYVEMSSDNTLLLEKMHLGQTAELPASGRDPDDEFTPAPLVPKGSA